MRERACSRGCSHPTQEGGRDLRRAEQFAAQYARERRQKVGGRAVAVDEAGYTRFSPAKYFVSGFAKPNCYDTHVGPLIRDPARGSETILKSGINERDVWCASNSGRSERFARRGSGDDAERRAMVDCLGEALAIQADSAGDDDQHRARFCHIARRRCHDRLIDWLSVSHVLRMKRHDILGASSRAAGTTRQVACVVAGTGDVMHITFSRVVIVGIWDFAVNSVFGENF
jgi:hypothetical protein